MPLILLSPLPTSLCVAFLFILSVNSHAEGPINMEDPLTYQQLRDQIAPSEEEETEEGEENEDASEAGESPETPPNTLPPAPNDAPPVEGQTGETDGMRSVQIAVNRAKLTASFENPSLYETPADFQTLQPFLSVDGKKIHTQEELEGIADRKISSFGNFSRTQIETHSPVEFQ